ncbi:MAG TPA: hypothetical protein VIL42_00105 [Sphingomicrobium sp.]|jgi:hypothetical protein
MSLPLIAGIFVVIVIALIAASQRRGPRVTQITRTRESDEDDKNA